MTGKLVRLNFFITLIGFLDTHLLIPVIALYAVALGAGVATVGLIVGLYSITNTFANFFGGRLVDRFGYKAPLMGGLVGDAVAMFGYSLCRFPWHLALVRAFHGSSGGLVGPATMSVMAKQASFSNRGKAMGFYGMAIATATLLGYGGGGIVASRLGYEFVFYIGGLLLIVATLLAWLMPRERVASSVKASWGEDFRKVTELLRRGNLNLSYSAVFGQYFAFGGIVTLLPLYVATLGMSAFHVGMLLAAFSLVFILVQMPGGFLSDKIGRLVPTIAGLSLAAVSVGALPMAKTFDLMVMFMVVFGIGYGLLFPSISALIADFSTPEEYGRATGMFHALITVAVAIGAPLMGWMARFVGIKIGLSLSSTMLLVALALVMLTMFRSKHG